MRIQTLALVALLALTLGSCTGGHSDGTESFRPAAAPAIVLPLGRQIPGELHIGVVVSDGAGRGRGSEWADLAAGARVAESRLDGTDPDRVTLHVVQDHGTFLGAQDAVRELVSEHVAGIVYASSGNHLGPALAAAASARTAVLLPYQTEMPPTGDPRQDGWRTGPTRAQIIREQKTELNRVGAHHPFYVSEKGLPAADVERKSSVTVEPGVGLKAALKPATDAVVKGTADVVVVEASAKTSAEIVAAVESVNPGTPMLFGPSATTPQFASRLAELGSEKGTATTAGTFTAVGPAAADTSNDHATVDFVAALRLAAQNPGVVELVGSRPFTVRGAATADRAGHDAVLAVAAAAVTAGSVDPSAVRTALGRLTMTADDGLAGPPLDFRRGAALQDSGVAALRATTRDPGIRTGITEPMPGLTWFPLPAGDRS